MFSFYVEAESPDALMKAIAARLIAIGFIKEQDAAPLPEIKEPAVEPARPSVTATAESRPAAAAPATPAATEASSPSGSGGLSPEEFRAKIRQALAGLVAGPRKGEVTALLSQYGGQLTKCPDDKLPELLQKAEALA